MAGDAPLYRSSVLELTCSRSGAGQTAEVKDGAGTALASSDGSGRIADPSGAQLLEAPVALEGRGEKGTDAKLTVGDPADGPLGEARVTKFSYGPRASKATLSLVADGAEVGSFEPQDRKGEEVAITVAGRPVGTLRKTGKKGILRTTTNYRVELTGELGERERRLVTAVAIRYQAVVAAAVNASARGD